MVSFVLSSAFLVAKLFTDCTAGLALRYLFNGIVFFNGCFFRIGDFTGFKMLHAYMPPKAEYLLADGVLKAIGDGQRHNHNSNA